MLKTELFDTAYSTSPSPRATHAGKVYINLF